MRQYLLLFGAVSMGVGACSGGGPAVDDSLGEYSWARGIGGRSYDRVRAVTVDSQGDAIVVGHYSNTVDFGAGPVTTNVYAMGYVAKYARSDGSYIWSVPFQGNAATDLDYLITASEASAIAVDAEDNVIVGSTYNRIIDFGGGPLESGPCGDAVVLKYDSDGEYSWGAPIDRGTVHAIVVDGLGNVFVAGEVHDVECPASNPSGTRQALLAKYSPTGELLWSQRFGDTEARGYSIAASPNGDVIFAGTLSVGAIDLGGGVFENTRYSSVDSFIARFTTDGGYLWSRHWSSSEQGDVRVEGIAAWPPGGVVAVGQFEASADFGRGTHHLEESERSIFVVALGEQGEPLWSSYVPHARDLDARSVAADSAGDIYVAGVAHGVADFGAGELGPNAGFVARYDGEGRVTSAQAVPNYVTGVAVTDGEVVLSGDFEQPFELGDTSLISVGDRDGFVTRLCTPDCGP